MATRDNQGIQIALILFVMITLLLAVTTFIYYRKASESRKEALAARSEQLAAETDRNILNYKTEALKYMIGAEDALTKAELDSLKPSVPADKITDIDKIEARFEQDMALYAEGLPPEERNYRGLPHSLGEKLRQANLELATQRDAQNQLLQSKMATEKREGERAQKAIEAQTQAAKDYAAEQAKFAQYKQQIDQQKQDLTAKLAAKDQEIQTVKAQQQAAMKDLNDQIARLQSTIEIMKTKLEGTEPKDTFERPDGQITWVNQRGRVVWINLGLADDLRRETTFSVYDQSSNGVVESQPKGSIEVTRLIDQHLAEARIVSDDLSNPILRGDYVHTPAWSPGRKIRFALAGLLDIDGDGKSDRELVESLIARNQGVIDAELLDDGTLRGALTASTRYLLLGERPSEHAPADYLQKYSQLIAAAQQYGIQKISVDEFLDYMGWKGEVKTVNLGRAASSRQLLGGSGAGSSGAGFRERRPAGGGF